MRTYRVLVVFVWLSLSIVPFELLSLGCYYSLCGPSSFITSHTTYMSILTLYLWLYPLIVFICLYIASRFKTRDLKRATIVLMLPIICLLPSMIIHLQINAIYAKREAIEDAKWQPTPEDYVCSTGGFIRGTIVQDATYLIAEGNNRSSAPVYSPESKSIWPFPPIKDLDFSTCKNQKGETFKNLIQKQGVSE